MATAVAAQPIGEEAQVPFLSFNPQITPDVEIPPQLGPEDLKQMEKNDPKLHYTWTLWEQHVPPKDKENRGKTYEDMTKQSISFSTVKDFWSCWSHLPQPSELL